MRGERSGGPWVDSAEGRAGLCQMRGPGKPPAEALFSPVRLRGSTWERVELEGGAVPGLGAGASDAPGDEEELERKTKEARRPGRGGAQGRVQAQKSPRRRGARRAGPGGAAGKPSRTRTGGRHFTQQLGCPLTGGLDERASAE